MNKRAIKRGISKLRRLANILRKVDASQVMPDGTRSYNQHRWVHECGAPACALGWWASRNPKHWTVTEGAALYYITVDEDGEQRWHSPLTGAQREFGLNYEDVNELFGDTGCGNAHEDPLAAAEYIERFAKQREHRLHLGTLSE